MKRSTIIRSAVAFLVTASLASSAISAPQFIEDIARNVAMSEGTLDAWANGVRYRGKRTGFDGSCTAVSVWNAERNRPVYNLRVCQDRVEDNYSPAPEYVSTPQSRQAADFVMREALLRGAATSMYEGYVLKARRIGFPNGPCAPVELVITLDGDLDFTGEKRVCQ